jgi:hypothetical protein
MRVRTHKILMAMFMGIGVVGAVDVGLANCDTVKMSVVNRSDQVYEVSGSSTSHALSVQQKGFAQGQLEPGQYYGQRCGLIKLVNVQDQNDVKYALVSPGSHDVSFVIHPDHSIDSTGLTDEGFDVKEHQDWYGPGHFLSGSGQ